MPRRVLEGSDIAPSSFSCMLTRLDCQSKLCGAGKMEFACPQRSKSSIHQCESDEAPCPKVEKRCFSSHVLISEKGSHEVAAFLL